MSGKPEPAGHLLAGPWKAFTERDKADLFLLKPHIEAAYRRLPSATSHH
jgi:hypothetical protein